MLEERNSILAKSMFSDLLDFIYPAVCQVCGQGFVGDNIWLCESCRKTLTQLPSPICPICRASQPEPVVTCSQCRRRASLTWIYSLGVYDDHYRELIHAFKYRNKPGLGILLAKMLAENLLKFPHVAEIEAVCAVPIHHRKESERGFNQSDILAQQIAATLNLPYYPNQLIQRFKNRDQIGLDVKQRFDNVHGIYQVTDDFCLAGMNVLLVDDVTTSGATLNSAAMTLEQAGVKKLAAATVANALEAGIDPSAMYTYLWDNF